MGVTGREVTAAYGTANTWGFPVLVDQQILLQSLDGMDNEPEFVNDDSFSQTWRGNSEISDNKPRSVSLTMQARFENMDIWYAAGMGAARVPRLWFGDFDRPAVGALTGAIASSQAANSFAVVLTGLQPVANPGNACNSFGIWTRRAVNFESSLVEAVNSTVAKSTPWRASTDTSVPASNRKVDNISRADALTSITDMTAAVNSAHRVLSGTASAHGVTGTFDEYPLAFEHVIDMAPSLRTILTMAYDIDVPKAPYIGEVPSMKVAGWSFKVGSNGVMEATFPIIGSRTNYIQGDAVQSLTAGSGHPNSPAQPNVVGVVDNAAAAPLGNRMFRKNMTFRMRAQYVNTANVQEDQGFSASNNAPLREADQVTGLDAPLKEISFDFSRPLAGDDLVVGQDYIIEPDDDGFVEMPVEMTFARMTPRTANSLYTFMQAAGIFKADLALEGPRINPIASRRMTMSFPGLQIGMWKAAVSGQSQVRPSATFNLRKADIPINSITGIDHETPCRMVLVNTRSTRLIPQGLEDFVT